MQAAVLGQIDLTPRTRHIPDSQQLALLLGRAMSDPGPEIEQRQVVFIAEMIATFWPLALVDYLNAQVPLSGLERDPQLQPLLRYWKKNYGSYTTNAVAALKAQDMRNWREARSENAKP